MTELKDILYVEDEPNIREIAKLALEEIGGFKVQDCESGIQALRVLDNYIPQLLLLDVMMPHMDGPATLNAIRTHPSGKSVPVIFMTAKVQAQELEKYKALGGIGVISKPFDAMLLSGQIQELWKQSNGR